MATIGVLIVFQALISMSYAAIVNSRHEFADDTDDFQNQRLQTTYRFATITIVMAVAAIALSGIATPLIAQWPDLPLWLIYAAVFLPLVLLVTLLGDMVPSTVGGIYAESLTPALTYPMRFLMTLLHPFVLLFLGVERLVMLVSGGVRADISITEEELLNLLDAGQSFEDGERKMIHSILQLDQTKTREVMVPRIDIVAVEKGTSIADARSVFLESGHSRLPVYEEHVDTVIGLVYVKDLLEVWHNGHTTVESVAEIMRPAHFVSEEMTADALLGELQQHKIHLAIVVDEYGGTAGIVTIENVLEEIVGDIQDEYDSNEIAEIVQLAPDEYRVDAGINLQDLGDWLGVELLDEDSDTLGGFIFTRLGRVPEPGEVLSLDLLEMRVVSVDGRRIREVHIARQSPPPVAEQDDSADFSVSSFRFRAHPEPGTE